MFVTTSHSASASLDTWAILLSTALPQQVSSAHIYKVDIYCMCFVVATKRPIQIIQPCNPSPCGVNAECMERNRAASCKCIRDYVGNPYVKCKPECVTNSECPRNKACVGQHCVDPCPGVCGAHATCQVASHVPFCTCDPGYTGNAFISCRRITTSKFLHCTDHYWV
jgi:hypothetical protein